MYFSLSKYVNSYTSVFLPSAFGLQSIYLSYHRFRVAKAYYLIPYTLYLIPYTFLTLNLKPYTLNFNKHFLENKDVRKAH